MNNSEVVIQFPPSAGVAELQATWAQAYYLTGKKSREKDFEVLLERANSLLRATPANPDLYVWRGIIKVSYAGVIGGLGALGLRKEAKADLEHVIALGGGLLQAAARTNLGALYFQVPSWPVAFGSDKQAEAYLLEGLAMAPADIDSNYFYALYLLHRRDFSRALQYLELANMAPVRIGRVYADQERRREILELITQQQQRP